MVTAIVCNLLDTYYCRSKSMKLLMSGGAKLFYFAAHLSSVSQYGGWEPLVYVLFNNLFVPSFLTHSPLLFFQKFNSFTGNKVLKYFFLYL